MLLLMSLVKALLSSAREHRDYFFHCLLIMCSCSRCSHAGIVNVVTDAVKVFKRPVHMASWDPIVLLQSTNLIFP